MACRFPQQKIFHPRDRTRISCLSDGFVTKSYQGTTVDHPELEITLWNNMYGERIWGRIDGLMDFIARYRNQTQYFKSCTLPQEWKSNLKKKKSRKKCLFYFSRPQDLDSFHITAVWRGWIPRLGCPGADGAATGAGGPLGQQCLLPLEGTPLTMSMRAYLCPNRAPYTWGSWLSRLNELGNCPGIQVAWVVVPTCRL